VCACVIRSEPVLSTRPRRGPVPLAAQALAGVLLAAALPAWAAAGSPGDLVASYIERWVAFYPSRAYARGHAASAARFERMTVEAVERWLAFNRATAASARERLAGTGLPAERRTDLAVLAWAAEDELATWAEDRPLRAQPGWYAERVSQALTHLLVRGEPSGTARSEAVLARLAGVAALCRQGIDSLETGKTLRTEAALRTLAGARTFYGDGLPALVADWPHAAEIAATATRAAEAIAALEAHLRDAVLPVADPSPALGVPVYAAKLARRTGGAYTPPMLQATAREELSRVRGLMIDEAARWQASLAPAPAEPLAGEALLAAALEAMEGDRTRDRAALLEEFVTLTARAEAFVEAEDIATVPKPTTLTIDLSPAHFSGAAIGGVYPSGPFDPGAATLFYVPSIADSAPPDAREGFYRSFNSHFNTMIISHEMFPGHYLQYKVAVSEAPAVRTLYSSGAYTEGWGSFVEEVMLDLARQVVRDGEGATKFVTIKVTGAVDDADARRAAMAIANSPLVKTAIAGEDPNWGRIVMAVGKSGAEADRDRLSIWFGETLVADKGWVSPDYREEDGAAHMKREEIDISVDLGLGEGTFTAYTCDLTHGYISINADYRS